MTVGDLMNLLEKCEADAKVLLSDKGSVLSTDASFIEDTHDGEVYIVGDILEDE